jgi:hypothetical protein
MSEPEMTSLTFTCPEGCTEHDHDLNFQDEVGDPLDGLQQVETLPSDPNEPPYDPAMDDIEDL